MDIFLSALKFAAILSTGIWGIVGLLVSYKDKEGRITVWGRRALIGAVLSTIIAASAQGVETYRQKLSAERERERAKEDFRRTQRLLFEIRRGLYPIKDIKAHASAEIRIEASELRGYLERLRKSRASLVKKEGGWENNTHVTLAPSLYPNREKEKAAWRLLVDFGVELEIYKTPLSPSDYDKRPNPDISIKTRPSQSNDVHLEIMEDEMVVRVTNWQLGSKPEDIRLSSGAITSALDLFGSQVFVSFRYDPGWDDSIYEIMQKSAITYVKLHIGSASIAVRPLKEHSNSLKRVYVCTLTDKNLIEGVDLTLVPEQNR